MRRASSGQWPVEEPLAAQLVAEAIARCAERVASWDQLEWGKWSKFDWTAESTCRRAFDELVQQRRCFASLRAIAGATAAAARVARSDGHSGANARVVGLRGVLKRLDRTLANAELGLDEAIARFKTYLKLRGGRCFYPHVGAAVNAAIGWLRARGVDTSTLVPVRMKYGWRLETPDQRSHFRIEFDARSGAHINVAHRKTNGLHLHFPGNQRAVDTFLRRVFGR